MIKQLPTSTPGLKSYILDNYLKNTMGESIANLGCGMGELSKILELDNEVYSIDIEKRNNDLKYILHDLNKCIPLDDDSMDTIFSIETIEHLENSRHFLRECKRAIKNKGKIIITTPNPTHLKARLKFLLTGILYGFDEKDYEISGHINPVFPIDFDRIARELGLIILERKKYKEVFVIVLTKNKDMLDELD